MIDLTTNAKDKDSFITKVFMDDESPFYHVIYASGREEVRDFSVHNLNATFLMMERQFLEFKDEYLDKIEQYRLKLNIAKLKECFLAIVGIFLTTAMPFPGILKAIIDLIIIICSLYYQKNKSKALVVCNSSENVIAVASEYLKSKSNFITKVYDPKTKSEEDWYLVTLSEIEEFASPRQLSLIGNGLNSSIKEEEAQRTNKVLKKIYGRAGE